MATLYVVRHGETDWNKARVFQGTTDIPLNDTGRTQADDLAKQFKDKKFDAIYCSPLVRARETCEIILNNNEHDGKINFDKRIRERCFGDYEGTPVSEIDLPFGSWWSIKNEMHMKNGESIAEMFKRVQSFLDDINKKHSGKNERILVVAHGGVARSIYFSFNPLPEDGDLFNAHHVDNCSVGKYQV